MTPTTPFYHASSRAHRLLTENSKSHNSFFALCPNDDFVNDSVRAGFAGELRGIV